MIGLTICIFLILYTYLLYPLFLYIQHQFYKQKSINSYAQTNIEPLVYIIIPIHNEEKTIINKIESIHQLSYPKHKIKVIYGLDACTDNSKQIISSATTEYSVSIYESSVRIGKPNMINSILATIPEDNAIIVLTDADILFPSSLLQEIANKFNIENIGIVDIKIDNINYLSIEENNYQQLSFFTKQLEAKLFGFFMGTSGACYAIKKQYFIPIPHNLLVDDLYISLSIFTNKLQGAIIDNIAVTENKQTTIQQEFKRKVRIACGSFQNLWYFKSQLFNPTKKIAFAFISNKFLKWITPFLLLYISCFLLITYKILILYLTLFLFLLGIVLSIFGWKNNPIKSGIYFIVMQIALIVGLIKFLKGVQTNVWQPTPK